jgi:hypothetical protein
MMRSWSFPSPGSASAARPTSKAGVSSTRHSSTLSRTRSGGAGDLWIGEGRLLYDSANPVHFVKILEFRGELVQRETIYTAEPFPAPDWRKPWAEEGAAPQAGGDFSARIRAGN